MKKVIVIGIIILFIGVGFSSGIGFNIEPTSYPLNAGETAWWKASECDGTTLYDCTGHNYDGTIYGADWTPGCCLDFDGIDDYVDLDNHSVALGMNKTDDYVIQVRFKSTGYGMLYSMSHTNPERPYFDLILDEDGKAGVILGDITCTFDLFTTGSYNDGDWHVLKCEFQGDTTNPTMNLYIDGHLDNTTTEWLCPMIDEDFLTAKIGRDSNAETDYLDGEIDDIIIYKNVCYPPGPPEAPMINGPMNGNPGQTLTYTFNAIDPEDDDVRFHIDWHDGNEEWTNYVSSGTDKTVTHQWSSPGDYTITAYAQDEYGWIGPSTTFMVIIPRNKLLNLNLLKWRLNNILQILQPLSISTGEVKHETTVRIHRSNEIIPYTLKLTEKESAQVDRIFDNLKVSLDSAETGEEIDEIYDEAVESLYKLGLFPRMTLKEAKQLVNGKNKNQRVTKSSSNFGNADENFDCRISGTASNCWQGFSGRLFRGLLLFTIILVLIRNIGICINFPFFTGRINYMTLGRYFGGVGYENHWSSSKGWVWTNGTNGVIKWEGGFFGDIDYWDYEDPYYPSIEGWFKGVHEFNGVFISDPSSDHSNFLGNAEHVRLSYTPNWP